MVRKNNTRLLFITQKIHQNDDDLAFVILWIKELIRQGTDISVICLERGVFDNSFPVYSLGKEVGLGKFARSLRFLKLIFTLNYNRVFVHMNPEYFTLGGWYWWLKRIPMYLWYTHYVMHFHIWLAGHLSKRLFAATAQSLPQYEGSPKKVITGHGIDINFWLGGSSGLSENNSEPGNLLTVHRICRSKRLQLGLLSLKYLPESYNLTVYGRDVEKDYYKEMTDLISRESLSSRARLAGPLPMRELKGIYPKHRIMVNMASETIDKTMLEGMLFGVYPVTTAGNSRAIGLPVSPKSDEPQSIAEFIIGGEWRKYDRKFLIDVVKNRHSLESLIRQMNSFIKEGN